MTWIAEGPDPVGSVAVFLRDAGAVFVDLPLGVGDLLGV